MAGTGRSNYGWESQEEASYWLLADHKTTEPYKTLIEARNNLISSLASVLRRHKGCILFSEKDGDVCRGKWSRGCLSLLWQHYCSWKGPEGKWHKHGTLSWRFQTQEHLLKHWQVYFLNPAPPYLWICHRGWSTIAPLLIVYDPYMSFLFHTTQRPWIGVWDCSPITPNGFQNSQIESGLLLDANLSHWHSKPLERLKVLRRCRSHRSRREYSIWSWNRCIRSSASSNAQPEWKTRGVLLSNPLRKWAKARVHRERSLGHNRGCRHFLTGRHFILKTDQK